MKEVKELDVDSKRELALLTKQEGWAVLKKAMDNWETTNAIAIINCMDEEQMKILAFRLKFGMQALDAVFSEAEKVAEGLDKR